MVQKRGPKRMFPGKSPEGGKLQVACKEEKEARLFIGRYRRRLTWLLHIPEWESLFTKGLEVLHLPGASQGINLRGRLNALPLTHKYQLLSWVAESFRGHLATRIGLRIAVDWGLMLPPAHTMDTSLSTKVWEKMREDFILNMGVENRRYQEYQHFLYTRYYPLIERSVRRVVFDSNRHPDAIQEGALGLLTAIDHISEESEQGFTTYAQTWIVRYVRNYLIRERFIVHVPLNLASRTLSEAGEKEKDGRKSAGTGTRQTAEEAAELLLQTPLFLDAPPEEGKGSIDIADPRTMGEENHGIRKDLQRIIKKGLAALTEKQREVIEARFGLAKYKEPQTLEAISREIGISYQQVSQREKRGLQRLSMALKPLLSEIQ